MSDKAFDYVEGLKAAQKIVEASPLWKRFIDGTPLSNDIAVMMCNFAASQIRIGPTGEFPDGKSYSEDEGELKFAIAHDQDNVIINFGSPVAWMAMPPDAATQLAELLTRHAKEIR